MTFLMRVCGVAASVLMLTICSAVVAGAEPASQTNSDSAPPATITLQISSGSTGRTTTTVTVEVLPGAAGQPTQIRVATDSDSRTPAILAAAIGASSVNDVSVDMQHPFDWNLVASAPTSGAVTTPTGCGPHPQANIPGCQGPYAQVTTQPAAASAAGAAPPAAGLLTPEVAGQQATPSAAATAPVAPSVTSPTQAATTAATGQPPKSPQAPPSAAGSTASTPTAPSSAGDTASAITAPPSAGDTASTTQAPPSTTGSTASMPPPPSTAGNTASATSAPSSAAGSTASTTPPPSTAGNTASATSAPPSAAGSTASTPLTYTVQPGDTLRGVAVRFYGDPNAFARIARANARRVMSDGLTFVDPGVIRPGWELSIPGPTRAVADRDGAHWYTVQPGDTLVGIAARLLGDGQRWPEVYALNRATQLGDDRTLAAGPGLIRPGMQLLLPGRASNTADNTSARNDATGVQR